MDESQITCDNYRCHEYGSKMQRNVYYEDDDEMEYFLCNKCHKSTTPQVVEIKMGDCYMCDKPAVFIAHDLPTGEKPFCSELHFCQYARLSYHGEGYYGFTDPTKVKEPARLARARKRLKYAESFESESSLPKAYIMQNFEKKIPYEIHVAGCNHGNLAGGDSDAYVFGDESSSIKNTCKTFIGMWVDNFQGMPKEMKPSDAEIDAINNMTFSKFMKNKYVKSMVPVKLSPCCKKDIRIKEYCDNNLVKDIVSVRLDAEATNEWKVGDKVKIINHISYRIKPSDIGKIATIVTKYDETETYDILDDDGKYHTIASYDLELYELYIPPKTNPRKARLKKRFGFGAESFSAEKVKKEILEDDDDRLVMKFIYKDREGKLEWSDNEDGKGGVLSFGDNPFKKGERMSRLPHTQIIDSATSKLAAKEMFRLSLDRKCHTCKEPIYKKDIGSCGWCEDEMGPSKFDDTYFYEDDWFKRLSPTTQDEYIHDLANKNPYCRDCLYYYGLGKNYPSAFDKESANYYLANAVCDKHWDEIVAEGGLSKDTKRNSLYEIENVSPRERMMKQRFGFGAEAFSSENGDKTNVGIGSCIICYRQGLNENHSVRGLANDPDGGNLCLIHWKEKYGDEIFISNQKKGMREEYINKPITVIENAMYRIDKNMDGKFSLYDKSENDMKYFGEYNSIEGAIKSYLGEGDEKWIKKVMSGINVDEYGNELPPQKTIEELFDNRGLAIRDYHKTLDDIYTLEDEERIEFYRSHNDSESMGVEYLNYDTYAKTKIIWEPRPIKNAESFSSENGELQLKESIKRTKMSMIRTGLAITTFTIVMWNLWTNKKQEKDISEIMDMI